MPSFRSGLLTAGLLLCIARQAPGALITGSLRSNIYARDFDFALDGMARVRDGEDCMCTWRLDQVSQFTFGGPAAPWEWPGNGYGAVFLDPSGSTTYGQYYRASMQFLPGGLAVLKYSISPFSTYSSDPVTPLQYIGTFYGSYERYQVVTRLPQYQNTDPIYRYSEVGTRMYFTHGTLADGRMVGTPEPSVLCLSTLGIALLFLFKQFGIVSRNLTS